VAFRNMAKKAHPDKGGSQSEMAELSRCKELLINPKTRARYDSTGDTEPEVDNTKSDIISKVMPLVYAIIEEGLSRDLDPCAIDIFKFVKDEIRGQLREASNKIASANKQAGKLRRISSKIKSKKENIIKRAIETQAEECIKQAEFMKEEVKLCEDSLAFLEDYTFEYSNMGGGFPWE